MGDSSSRHSINAGTYGTFLLAPLLDEGVASSSAHFFFSPMYILAPPLHSPISTLLIFERESSSSSFSPDCLLLLLAGR